MKKPEPHSKPIPLSGDTKGSTASGKQIAGKAEQSGDLAPKELEKGLYLTATPIGHARDVSLRALAVLAGVDLIAAEDTRVTSKLLSIHRISKTLMPYNDHNAAQMRPKLLAKLNLGTELLRSACETNTFLTIDRWNSTTDFDDFQARFGATNNLDAEFEGWTSSEKKLGIFSEG